MSISMYDASIPLFKQLLGSMSAVLDKGAAFGAGKQIEKGVLMQLRLAPDMFPLLRQVQVASDSAKGGAARLAGVDIPSYPDEEVTIDDAKARIAKTIAFLDTLSRDAINASAEREIVITVGPQTARREMRFTGATYLMRWVIPNFTFHCATAYDILRANGVELGKRDYLGAVQ
jgi:hypothetical protein